MAEFDLVVIGAGPGGVAAAIRGAQLGASVAIIEQGQWGGLCLNQACIPTKFLAAAAERLETSPLASGEGEKGGEALDLSALWSRKDELTAYFSMGTKGLLASNGIELIQACGRLAGPGKVAAGEDVLSAKAVIIACGGDWVPPAIPGGDLVGVISSSQFLAESELPRRALVLGGGPWQLELAQFLAAAGSEAAIVEEQANILPGWEEEISQRLRAIINKPPLTIINRAQAKSFQKRGGQIQATLTTKEGERRLTVDRVIYLSRRPRLEGLGLESAGLKDLSVDQRQATAAPEVFAVGDATGQEGLSHLASAQGVCAAENALGGDARLDPRLVPRVAYTRPQAASVGLSEAQAEELGYPVLSGEAPMGVSPMAMIAGQSNGVIKVVGEEAYGEVLGVHMLAPVATEIIGLAALALQMEATLEDLCQAAIPHPTIGESLVDAARDALGWAIYQPRQARR
ncbi:MAG: NAD(P)/FAD-dependent oxidoreductase [Thermodesulfobacteriota bacterium]